MRLATVRMTTCAEGLTKCGDVTVGVVIGRVVGITPDKWVGRRRRTSVVSWDNVVAIRKTIYEIHNVYNKECQIPVRRDQRAHT